MNKDALIEEVKQLMEDEKYEEAYSIVLKLAEEGDLDAQETLGDMYFDGQGVDQDLSKAMEWLEKAALGGNPDAQWKLGTFYEFGRVSDPDYEKAMEWYTKSAEADNPTGQESHRMVHKSC